MEHKKNGQQFYRDLDKIKKVYLSCTTAEQITVADNMLEAFNNKWGNHVSLEVAKNFLIVSLVEVLKAANQHKMELLNSGNTLHNT